MILTEKEASTKACVRSGGAAWAPGPMPDVDTPAVWRCVGARCMAWRHAEATRRQDENSGIHIVGGYCGLVGKP